MVLVSRHLRDYQASLLRGTRGVPLTGSFSESGYRGILTRALDFGYRISTFEKFEPPQAEKAPVLLLRHDVDHSLRSAAQIARLEARLGVRATYFIQVASDFYNLLSSESRGIVGELRNLGHEIGLHYDASRYQGLGGTEELKRDLSLLRDLCGRRVRSAAQHIPIDSPRFEVLDLVENEAYEARFTRGEMSYISDSLMQWRQATPHSLLEERRSFQLLTHPLQWVGTVENMAHALNRALEEECAWLRNRYAETSEHYARLLREREERDVLFQQRYARESGTAAGSD